MRMCSTWARVSVMGPPITEAPERFFATASRLGLERIRLAFQAARLRFPSD
jgi:hypothetical protein